jgi:cellulose biosynthesis protein BcsQ
MTITIYSFYNNKGGVGKTTLCANLATLYAEKNPDKQILAIDFCPQANLSQFLLGGGSRGYQANQKLQAQATRRNIVGFIDWLLNGNSSFSRKPPQFKIDVNPYNKFIPENFYLIAGDSFLESFSLAISYAVLNPNNLNAWKEFMEAIEKLCQYEHDSEKYEDMTVFIDCNPSFAIYTQMALASSDYIIIPTNADPSSQEGIRNILIMLYGKYPTAAIRNYAQNRLTFKRQIDNFNMSLPLIYEFVFNNYTKNLGAAYAFEAIKDELTNYCYAQFQSDSSIFFNQKLQTNSLENWKNSYFSDIKDFHTAGRISVTRGIPLHHLSPQTYRMPNGNTVQLQKHQYEHAVKELKRLAGRLK